MAALVGALASAVSSAASGSASASANSSSAGLHAPSNPSLSRNSSSNSTAFSAHPPPSQAQSVQQGRSLKTADSPSRGHGPTDAETDGDDEEADDADGDGDGEDDDDDENAQRKEGEGFSAGDLMQENTVKSGYLWKKGEKRKNWKKRWFVLRASRLAYYKNEKEYQLLRLIDMSDVHTVASVELKRQENSFGIVTPRRTYYVKASSRQDMLDWIERLNEVKTQLSHSTTMTQDLAKTSISTGLPVTNDSSQPGQVAIPGIGVFNNPAQPRPIPSMRRGGSMSTSGGPPSSAAFSPLTATSDSESSEAQRFGLSYAGSSFSQSALGSSPGRHAARGAYSAGRLSSGGYSPQSHSGGEASDQLNRSASNARRDRSVGSSGGERLALPGRGTSPAGAGGVISSSEEEEEDDWDEDEGADQAMPLPALTPGGQNLAPVHSEFVEQVERSQQIAITPEGSKQSNSDFLRDPSRVLLQGYLMKQGNRRKHWRKRWFVLTSSKLMYTRSHMDGKAHRQIPVSSILDAIEYESKKANKDTSTPLTSPTTSKTFNFGSFGEAGEVTAAVDGDNELSTAPSAALVSSPSATGQAQAPAIERRSSVISAAAAGVASSVGASVGGVVGGGAGAAGGGTGKRKKENCFRIITPKRNFLICAPSEEEEIKWLSTLQTLISRVRDAQTEKEKAKAGVAATYATSSQQDPVHGFNPSVAASNGSEGQGGSGSRRTRSISTHSNSGGAASVAPSRADSGVGQAAP